MLHFIKFFSVSLVFLSVSYSSSAQIFFENQAPDQGIDYAYKENNVMGAGVSFCDFNGDGWDDITFATAQGDSIYFYENNEGTFSRVLLAVGDTSNVKQINWVDIDNDGDKDLFIVGFNNGNRLYENLGDMNLQNITEASNIDSTILDNFGASWGDYNNDSYLDVYISTYIFGTEVSNMLYKNNGDNTFTDVTTEAGLYNTNTFSFCSAWLDYNNDGWLDIYASTDRYNNSNILYENNGDGTFIDVSSVSNTGISIDAMSTTIDDYNYDGYLDIYVSNTDLGNVLLQNNVGVNFTDTAGGVGVIYNAIGWGAAFLDAENDGDLDLYVSGMGMGIIRHSSLLFENDGTGMYTSPSGIGFVGDSVMSFGNAIGDFNNDGYYDIVVSNNDTAAHLWENGGGENTYVKILLQGTESNRDGIGSWIKTYVDGEMQVRYTLCGEGFSSQFSNSEIIGLGEATLIDSIEIEWLSGIRDVFYNVPSNQSFTFIEGSSQLPELVISASGSTYMCVGDSIELTVNSDYEHYLWSNGDTTASTYATEFGAISCEAWSGYSERKTSEVEIMASIPEVSLGNDSTLCVGESLELNAGSGWTSINWSTGSTMESITVDTTGLYSVSVSDTLNCTASDSIEVEFTICGSISEAALSAKVQIYPNPASSSVFIQTENNPMHGIAVLNEQGKLVLNMQGNGNDKVKIPLESLTQGNYFIQIETDKGLVLKNLIIQR